MRNVTTKISLVTLLLVMAASLISAQKRPVARKAQLIRNISLPAEIQGCGCYFQFPKEDPNSNRYVFSEDFSEDPPLMNIDGENVRLKLVSSSEPSDGVSKKGQKFSRNYVSGDIRVRMDLVTTSVCAPNDESCESTGYDVMITVSKGLRKQTVKAVGGCGC